MAASRPKILVTGVSGQVGHALLTALEPLGEILPFDILPPSPAPKNFQKLDLADADALRQAVRELRPALIVNPAAYTAVDKAESEAATAAAINATAPGVLAREAEAIGAALIHYSTDYVFDGSGSLARTEDAPIGPLNVYGQTKLDGEIAVRSACSRHLIFRTSWVFSSIGQNFVKTMLRLGSEREVLKIVADQIGAPTSATMLAQMTARAIQVGLDRGWTSVAGTYHLASREVTSWHGFAEEIFRQARAQGMSLKVQSIEQVTTANYPTPARRPLNSRLNCQKFESTFAVQLPTWQDSLKPVVEALVRPS